MSNRLPAEKRNGLKRGGLGAQSNSATHLMLNILVHFIQNISIVLMKLEGTRSREN